MKFKGLRKNSSHPRFRVIQVFFFLSDWKLFEWLSSNKVRLLNFRLIIICDFRGRVKHGRHFTFKSVLSETVITLVASSVTGTLVDAEHPYVAQGAWLQVLISDDLAQDMATTFQVLANPETLSLPKTFSWTENKLAITIVPDKICWNSYHQARERLIIILEDFHKVQSIFHSIKIYIINSIRQKSAYDIGYYCPYIDHETILTMKRVTSETIKV